MAKIVSAKKGKYGHKGADDYISMNKESKAEKEAKDKIDKAYGKSPA
jgi:hypothetical protein